MPVKFILPSPISAIACCGRGFFLRIVIGQHHHVFKVNYRHTAGHAIDPDDRIGATMLNPIGIEFGLHVLRICLVEEKLQTAAVTELEEFETVVVID